MAPGAVQQGCCLVVLLLSVACICLARPDAVPEHRCVHDSHVAPALRRLQGERQASLLAGFGLPEDGRRRLAEAAAATPVPIRIQPVFQLSGLDAATSSFLTNTLVPAAVNYFSQVLSVKVPPSGPLLLQRNCLQYRIWTSGSTRTQECLQWDDGRCQIATVPASFFAGYSTCSGNSIGQCTTTPGGAGANNTDFLLLVTSQTTAACQASTLAHSSYCYQDPVTDRPLAGNVNFCPSAVNQAALDRQLLVAIHETIHALGFSDSLFSYFKDASGKPQTAVTAQFTERGRAVTKVVSPTVLARVRDHFGCPTLNGAELENDGGNGTALSHWEARIFQGEAMLGILGQQAVYSDMTLALLQDSGWYQVNFQMAEFLQAGFKMGCDFPMLSCAPAAMPPVFSNYYCNGTQRLQSGPNSSGRVITTAVAQTCTYDNLAVGFCGACDDGTCNTDGCLAITGYSNKLCTDPANANSLDTSWGRAYGVDSRCFLQGDEFWVKGQEILSASGAGCFTSRCSWPAGGQPSLQVEVGAGNWVQCVDNQMVDLKAVGFSQGRLGPCPVAADFCRFATCPGSCSGFGTCYMGVCTCDPGHGGPDCSQRICSQDSNCADTGAACNLTTKLCMAAAASTPGSPSIIITAPTGNGTAAAPLAANVPAPTAYDPSKVGVASPGPISATILTPPGQLAPTDTRPTPSQGVLVISTISFGGGDISQMTNTQNRLYFESNFTADMAAAARAAGYAGQIQVVIDSFRQGSIIVDSTTALLDARTYAEADRLVISISSNPGAIFSGDSYFQTLPAGTVNSSNVRATAATTQSNLNPSNSGSSNLFKDGKFLHLRWLWWAVIGGGVAALCLFCCICSSIGAKKKRRQAGPLVYRQNISAETLQSLQREGVQAPYWQDVQYGPSGHGPESRRVQDYPTYQPPPSSHPPPRPSDRVDPVYPAYPPPRRN